MSLKAPPLAVELQKWAPRVTDFEHKWDIHSLPRKPLCAWYKLHNLLATLVGDSGWSLACPSFHAPKVPHPPSHGRVLMGYWRWLILIIGHQSILLVICLTFHQDEVHIDQFRSFQAYIEHIFRIPNLPAGWGCPTPLSYCPSFVLKSVFQSLNKLPLLTEYSPGGSGKNGVSGSGFLFHFSLPAISSSIGRTLLLVSPLLSWYCSQRTFLPLASSQNPYHLSLLYLSFLEAVISCVWCSNLIPLHPLFILIWGSGQSMTLTLIMRIMATSCWMIALCQALYSVLYTILFSSHESTLKEVLSLVPCDTGRG